MVRDGRRVLTPNSLRELVKPGKIYVDKNQDVAHEAKETEGFEVLVLPVADYAWLTKEGKLVGIEEKKPPDFETSFFSRRLQRQLRDLKDECDIPLLALRMIPGLQWTADYFALPDKPRMYVELAKWLTYGTQILFPVGGVLEFLYKLRFILDDSTLNRATIISGHDNKRAKKGSLFETTIRNMIPGVGPRIAQSLKQKFAGDFMKALNASAEEWASTKYVHQGIVKWLQELRNES